MRARNAVTTVPRVRAVKGRRALVAAVALAACTTNAPPPGPACPNDLPGACPSPPPSYARDVAPVIAARCGPCHAPGGVEAAQRDFSAYATVHTQRVTILTQIHACLMPPADAGTLDAAERATLQGWLVCGAPDN